MGEDAVAPWLHRRVERVQPACVAEELDEPIELEQVLVAQGAKPFEREGRLRSGRDGVVVAHDRVALGGDVADELVELEPDQPAFAPQLDAVAHDPLGHPRRHLGSLQGDEHVVEDDCVLELERGEPGQDLLQPLPVGLERAERLVRLREDVGHGVELVAGGADEDRDRLALLGDGDHERTGLLRDALRGAMAGPGLLRGDRRIRHQLYVGPGEPLDRGVDDDRPVHLGQLVEQLRTEGRIEPDAAAVQERELSGVAEHDQRALVGANHVVDGLPERRPGRNRLDRRQQVRVAARVVVRRRAGEAELCAQPFRLRLFPRLVRHRDCDCRDWP